MLTSEHAIVEFEAGRARPDRLLQGPHGHYLDYAQRMLAIYRDGLGRRRRDLHHDVAAVFADEADCPTRRIAAFCKLLDDAGEFHVDRREQASQLRLKVFAKAAPLHPLVGEPDRLFEHSEREVKDAIAAELGMPWPAIEDALYADVLGYQRLDSFEGYADPQALLSRYNVAQVQACLYRAESMTVEAAGDFQSLLRYAKLARLLHRITPMGPSRYRIELSGPASVLRATRGYGVNFARFLPALLACKGWRMTATIRTPWKGTARLMLKEGDGLRSHLPPASEFDSGVEEAFAARFAPHREGWQLIREGEVLHAGQTVFIPDFLFRHDDGTEVLLEIVGFWTPEYLAAKRHTLSLFGSRRLLLALPERSLRPDAEPGENVILYKTALKLAPILEALERLRRTP